MQETQSKEKSMLAYVSLINTILAITEPILVSYPSLGWHFALQIIVLAVSTLFYMFGIFLLGRLIQNADKTKVNIYLVALFQPAYFSEGLLFLIGWAFIFKAPGLAAVRCFRVFSFFWAIELFRSSDEFHQKYLTNNGSNETKFSNLLKNVRIKFFTICRQTSVYIRKLYAELFTPDSRGGLVLLLITFYTSYVIAAVLWRDRSVFEHYYDPTGLTNGTAGDWHCVTLRSCWINVVRLTFYDGNGFDLLSSILYSGKWHLFLLLLIYMCFTGIVLLNGLLGIFSYAFEGGASEPRSHSHIKLSELQLSALKKLKKELDQKLEAMKDLSKEIDDILGSLEMDTETDELSVDADKSSDPRPKIFFILTFLLSVADAVIIGCGECDRLQNIQLGVLIASTALFVLSVPLTAYLTSENPSLKDVKHFDFSGGGERYITIHNALIRHLKVLSEPASLFEGACLLIGWACFYRSPGFACLRCFRVFRALWNLQLYDNRPATDLRSFQVVGGSQRNGPLHTSAEKSASEPDAGGEGSSQQKDGAASPGPLLKKLSWDARLCLSYFKSLGRELSFQWCGSQSST